MPTKKRFFTKNNARVGKKSGKPRGKYQRRTIKETITSETVPSQSQKGAQALSIDKTKKQELPNNSLSITEHANAWKTSFKNISWQKGALFGFFAILISICFWQVIALGQHLFTLKNVLESRAKLSEELTLWENVAMKYPNYRDAYFQSAILAYRLGENGKKEEYIAKTLQIDPNFIPAQSLEKLGK